MVWDWIIIGSGFGGSVSALRLAEKGYSVLVLEKGRRWRPEDFPKTNWNLRKWLWVPAFGFRGFFKMTFLRHITALSGVGVGGGSLVYANTLPKPSRSFFEANEWGRLTDWETELEPHYRTARRMLGVNDNPLATTPDRILKTISRRLGREEQHRTVPVGVFFGEPGVSVPDPYFHGEGPDRAGCTHCGGCMVGCRYGAKNTLDQNYLWLAERSGVRVMPNTEAEWVRPILEAEGADADGPDPGPHPGPDPHPGQHPEPHPNPAHPLRYTVTARELKAPFKRTIHRFEAKNVIFAGGALGTVELLLKLRENSDGLPGLSPRVGDRVLTNSEVLVGITTQRRDLDLSNGVAITSILQTDEQSSIEPARFSSGSGFFRLLATPHAPGRTFASRMANGAKRIIRNPVRTLRAVLVPNWARYTTALLYMRTLEGYLRLTSGRSWLPFSGAGLRSTPGNGPLPTAAIPEATQLAEEFAKEVDGHVGSLLTETLLGIPTTAHILGGSCMGATQDEGVIDHRHRVFGYDGLYVIDGSAISANPGVNPSLTITALAERAMAFIPARPTGLSQKPLNGRASWNAGGEAGVNG